MRHLKIFTLWSGWNSGITSCPASPTVWWSQCWTLWSTWIFTVMRCSNNSILSRVACHFSQAIPWYATARCAGTGNGTTMDGKMLTRITSGTQSARIQLMGDLILSLRYSLSLNPHTLYVSYLLHRLISLICFVPNQSNYHWGPRQSSHLYLFIYFLFLYFFHFPHNFRLDWLRLNQIFFNL